MNTIGKILVILNFLFAVIVGVFLVLDVALRTQWKDAYVQLKRETDVLHQSRSTATGVNNVIVNDLKTALGEKATILQQLRDKDAQLQAEIASREGVIAELKLKLDEAVLAQGQAQKSLQRITDEITLSQQIIKDREGAITKLEADNKALRVIATNYESNSKARQSQNETLLEQIRELTQKMMRMELGPTPEGMLAVSDPNKPNPPAVKVSGVIEKVDAKDGTLVQISLGTDHGVNKNNTLDVFRTRPDAKYLGMIRIVEAYHHKSVGRLVGASAAARPQLKEGDQVASKIN